MYVCMYVCMLFVIFQKHMFKLPPYQVFGGGTGDLFVN